MASFTNNDIDNELNDIMVQLDNIQNNANNIINTTNRPDDPVAQQLIQEARLLQEERARIRATLERIRELRRLNRDKFGCGNSGPASSSGGKSKKTKRRTRKQTRRNKRRNFIK